MSEDNMWFAPKRYGFGSGLPISWKGWALTIGFMILVIGTALEFGRRPLQFAAILAPLIAVFLMICARTTRGGWRWRWGEDD